MRRRSGIDDQVRVTKVGWLCGYPDRVRQVDPGEAALVLARGIDAASAIAIVGQQQGGLGPRDQDGERGAPRARPDDGDLRGFEILPHSTRFQYESLTTIRPFRNVHRSQPRTSSRWPSVVVPVSVHSETPRSPSALRKCRSSP